MNLSDAVQFIQNASPSDLTIMSQEIKRRAESAVSKLRRGAPVIWRDKDGSEYRATVERVNSKTVSLTGGDHPRFARGVRVPKAWVRPAS